MSEKIKLSIVDQPLQGGEKDGLKTELYRKGLCRFIELTDTPITVALQGEWGSGKTSLMNALKNELCDDKGKSFFPVWINTWHHSMMANAELSVVSILQAMIEQLCTGLETEKKNETWSKFVGFGKRIGKVIAVNAGNVAGGMVGMKTLGSDVAAAAAGQEKEPAETGVAELKKSIEALIEDLLCERKKDGVIFFIDDLDRIDPPVAVQILELLKNIFDIKNCVFVLAIDYDVVVKGLKNKFGEMTAANEREFRSFFDKIIQLPFSMPVNAYQIDDFLIENLRKIEFITDAEAGDDELKQTLTDLAQLSVGRNPRSLKRLMNTLSLIQIMSKLKAEQSDDAVTATLLEKKLNFALVCLQICYPAVYNLLTREPNFKEEWNDSFATALELPELTPAERDRFKSDENFDEPWEQLLYRICQKSPFLKQHALDISRLLNRIAAMITGTSGAKLPDSEIGEYVRQAIEISAVTNVTTSENAAVRVENRTLDSWFKKEFRDKFAAEVNRIAGREIIKVWECRSKYMYLFESENTLNSVVLSFISDDTAFRITIEHKFEFMSGATDMEHDPAAAEFVGEPEIRRLLSEFAAKYGCNTQLHGPLTATRGNCVCISLSFVWVNAGLAMADVRRIASAFADYHRSLFSVHLAERQYGEAKRPLMDYLRTQDKVNCVKRWLDDYELGGVVQRLTKADADDAPYAIFRLSAPATFSIFIGNVKEDTLENYLDAEVFKVKFTRHTDGQHYVLPGIPAREIVDRAKELFEMVRT